MKRSLIIMTLFALCLTFNQAHAQRYLPGMKALQVTAGMADGVHWNDNTDFAYHIGVAYSVYTKMQIAGFSAGNTSKNGTIIRT